MFILLSAAIAPALALLGYFYMRNQMATEPRRTLIQAFLYGAVITFPILFIQYVMEQEGTMTNPFMTNVVFTSGIEEFFKWLIIFVLIFRHIEFDDPYDGILYGAAVSLGFATVENVLYLLSFGLNTAFVRALLPVSSHALFGVVMGYYFGKSKFSNNDKWKEYLFLSIFIPIALHFSYNLIWTLGGNFIYLMVPFMLFLWWFGLRKVKLAHQHLIEHLIENNKHS
ncbi:MULTISPECIES: glutamic-type intramembrane protease PrsW [Bacillales]|uniref:Protease PrsW n=1 Tax=Lysinibacillus louembei TaxID=1470088 RepID=A0ABZ0RWV0_9BACI|nr:MULTISPECIES: glutamic-type intramembrane protease PrsW [Bacillales]MCT6923137.1 glutamic-type intramembrane protease PrsW [Metasolibacillus sp.]MCT6939558.1 glutamic-type intramembrane protease PrsW [Metasolibacillus sp.]WPK11741.1 glutamic-type intramembrane protease PrsW [Lysinibacillus louembei]